MKRIILSAAALALATGLAGCSQKQTAEAEKPAAAAPEVTAPAATAAPASGSDMAGMAMSGDTKMAKGTGTVMAVDAAAGTITIDHAPIPEANWPAMKMAFKASPEVAKQVKAGDKVAFDLKLQGGGGEVISVTKQ
jgi:Cu/Ag efflux protein CusF